MAVVMLISSFFVIKGIPTLYESRALIVVYGNKYDDQTNGAQMAAVTEQVTSRSNLEAKLNSTEMAKAIEPFSRDEIFGVVLNRFAQ